MSLAERLALETPTRKPNFSEWLISLTPSDRKAFEAACKPDSGYSNVQLLRIMAAEGGPASKDSLAAYRSSLA